MENYDFFNMFIILQNIQHELQNHQKTGIFMLKTCLKDVDYFYQQYQQALLQQQIYYIGNDFNQIV